MAQTSQTYNGDGSNKSFTFTIPYLATTDIKVFIGGVETTDFTVNGQTVTLGTATDPPPTGTDNVEIRRSTNNDTIQSNFQSGSALRASDFNANFTQFQYVTQEAFNQADFALANSREGDVNVGFKSAIQIANEARAAANAATSTINDISPYSTINAISDFPTNPANGDRISITNSTNIQNPASLPSGVTVTGVPNGFIGSIDLSVRLRYNSTSSAWEWNEYYVPDPDNRYLRSIANNVGTAGQYLVSDAQGFAQWADFAVVTTTTDGYMSSADKTKLDNIEPNAEVNHTPNWLAALGTDGYIENKPTFATVATSGDYTDLSNTPVGFSGSYLDLTDTPTIPAAQIQADWDQSVTTALDFIKNKPTLFSGNYTDLNGRPALVSIATTGEWTDINNKPNFATVATTGSYNDLSARPTIPPTPLRSNWNETDTTSLAFIENKPNTIDNANYINTLASQTSATYKIPLLTSDSGFASLVNTTGLTFNTANNNLVSSGDVTAFSDARLKTNVSVISDALNKVSAINGVTFYRSDLDIKQRQTGLIAQELQKVLPEAVVETPDGTLAVAYGNVVGLLVEAIKELKSEIEGLKNGSSN